MRSFTCSLGGEPVVVYAPEIGKFDAARFAGTFTGEVLVGYDVETTALAGPNHWAADFRIRLLQFATSDVAWVLNPDDPEQRDAATGLLRDRGVSFASHSSMDALSTAVQFGVDISARTVDTLVLAGMAHTAKNDDRDLKSMATLYGMPELARADVELAERFRDIWPGRRNAKKAEIEEYGWKNIDADDETYLRYAGLDPMAALRLAFLLTTATGAPYELVEKEVWLAGRAVRVQVRGMRVDVPLLEELHAEAAARVTESKAAVAELTGGVNAGYAPGIVSWFGEHGADWSRWDEIGGQFTETGSPSLGKGGARLLREFDLDDTAQQVVDHLVEFKANTDVNTKSNEIKERLGADGRLHPRLVPNGASPTSRMTSSAPNFQNFSAAMKHVLIPDDGSVLAAIDFAQVELRVAAALAREQQMIDTIIAGGDLHKLTADALGIPRPVAKRVNFLILSGGGGRALRQQTGVPLEEAYSLVRQFKQQYPSIEALVQYMAKQSEVYTISRRRLYPAVYQGRPKFFANINNLVQSSARDLLIDAWHRFDIEFGHGERIWFPIHDELVLHVPEDQVDAILATAERCMTFDFRGVPIAADGIVLRDGSGVSRWMGHDEAEKIATAKEAA